MTLERTPSQIATAAGGAGDLLGTQRVITGWSSANYLERVAPTPLEGNAVTGFEAIVAVLQPEYVNFTAGYIAGNSTLVSGQGYGLIVESTNPNPGLANGSGARENLAFFDDWLPFNNYRVHVQSVGTDLSNIRATYQARENLSVGSAGYTVGGLDFRMGRTAFGGANPYNNGAVIAFGVKTTGLFTDAELRDNLLALLTTGGFDTTICQHAFRAAALDLGAMPATWVDEGSTAGEDLSLVGSLTVEDWPYGGLVDQTTQDFSTLVTRNAATGALTPNSENYNTAGPHDVGAPEILVDTNTTPVTVRLPGGPVNGGIFRVYDAGQNAGTNNITIDRNGNTINGAAANLVLNVNGNMAHLIYDSVVGDWFAKVT